MRKSSDARLADVLGGLGYVACVFLWLWTALLFFPWLKSLVSVRALLVERPAQVHSFTTVHYSLPGWLLYLLVAAAFFVVLVSIVYIVRLPARTARSISHVTHTTARVVARKVTPQPARTSRRLFVMTETITWWIKIALVLIPILAILIALLFLPMPLENSVVIAVTLYLVSWPVAWFLLQYIITIITRKHHSVGRTY
ncbi:MAG TPA: hypothetical protein VFQ70_04010 [Candidatus Saccharimonadaceae bacterium]|nr:hypothetical protein [Candidatus Saccharimonadaceae bacterium]